MAMSRRSRAVLTNEIGSNCSRIFTTICTMRGSSSRVEYMVISPRLGPLGQGSLWDMVRLTELEELRNKEDGFYLFTTAYRGISVNCYLSLLGGRDRWCLYKQYKQTRSVRARAITNAPIGCMLCSQMDGCVVCCYVPALAGRVVVGSYVAEVVVNLWSPVTRAYCNKNRQNRPTL